MRVWKYIGLSLLTTVACSNPPEKQKGSNEEKPELIAHFGEGEDDYYQADNLAGHIHTFNAKREFNWEEHPTGKMLQETNNMGFREDEDYSDEYLKDKEIILVIGDSHTDGVVKNSESFPNQLESMLNNDSLNPGRTKTVEVINAGVGYYGPQNYLGALKKYLELKPGSVVICFYVGNDFLDAIRIEAENQRLTVPKRTDSYYLKLWELDETYPGFTGQLMNQVKFFRTYPHFKEDASITIRRTFNEINKICKENNIDLLVTLLPSKLAAEPQTDSERIKDAISIMRFKAEDVELNQIMGNSMEKWLTKKEIANINLLNGMQNRPDTLYWKKDYHLNHNGHKLVAEIINEYLTKGGAVQ